MCSGPHVQGPARPCLHPQSPGQLWCSACMPLIPQSLRQLGVGACPASFSLWALDSPCPEGSQESWFLSSVWKCWWEGCGGGRRGTASLGSVLEEEL